MFNAGYSLDDDNETYYNRRAAAYEKWLEKEQNRKRERRTDYIGSEEGAVLSSWLDTIGYDDETGEATATFKNGYKTTYPMSRGSYEAWKASPSKGRWLHGSGLIKKNKK
jgi:hypothetical protein